MSDNSHPQESLPRDQTATQTAAQTGARAAPRIPEDLRPLAVASVRPLLQTIARMIATDRRAAVLATETAEILLANAPANRLALDATALATTFDWPAAVTRARAAGSVQLSATRDGHPLEGELVHLPLGPADGYLLRLAESDQEAAWLRNRARSATLMRVAHDLRTPIQSLLAIAETALPADGTAPAPETRDQLQRAAELALDHIDNVLNVIRGEASLAGLQPDEDFSLTEELRSLVAMISPIVRGRGADIRVTLDPPEEVWLHGPVRFVRALCQNMIDNSAKYGGRLVDIALTCRTTPAPIDAVGTRPRITVTLQVSDLGGGLPATRKAQLNEALGQAGNIAAPPVAADGTRPSAGLNVLAHALRQLGGELEVFDRAASGDPLPADAPPGTLVTGAILRACFCLPEGQPRDTGTAPRPAPLPGTAPLAGRTLMVVEDSPASRDWLVHVLRGAGARVHPAGNGMEALALLARQEVRGALDLVLTDMTLPYMNGFELAHRIAAGRASGALDWQGPVLGLTAHVDDRIRSACRTAGILRVLEKPIRPSALCEAILDALGTGAQSPAPQPVVQPCDDSFDRGVVDDLLAQFGPEGTRRFMTRAADEAREVVEGLRRDGIVGDTGRRLHAATGACGLTGLKTLEAALRQAERAVEGSDPALPALLDRLEEELRRATRAITGLS